ncbi:MAG: hypothetical protein ACOY5F_21950 [Pseudomonadota bacterium]
MLARPLWYESLGTSGEEGKTRDFVVVSKTSFASAVASNFSAFVAAKLPAGVGFHLTAACDATPALEYAVVKFRLPHLPGRTMRRADARHSKRNDTSRKVISLVPVRPAQAEPCTDAVPARGFMFPER